MRRLLAGLGGGKLLILGRAENNLNPACEEIGVVNSDLVESTIMNPKPHPNHSIYLEVLRRLTPEQRLEKAIELSSVAKQALRDLLRKRFPHLDDAAFHQLFLKQLETCHNRNY